MVARLLALRSGVRQPSSGLLEAEREPWRRLWEDVAGTLAADPLEQGRKFAARRQWERAADGYARSVTRGPTDDAHFWFEFAALSLLSGDRPSHARTCSRMLRLCKERGLRPYLLARACTLAPKSAQSPEAGHLAEKELDSASAASWSLTEQGALAYRDGHYQAAVSCFERSLQSDRRPGAAVLNWLWLALAKYRLGSTDEAHRRLDEARAWLEQHADGLPERGEQELGLHMHNWLEAHVPLAEAKTLIAPVER